MVCLLVNSGMQPHPAAQLTDNERFSVKTTALAGAMRGQNSYGVDYANLKSQIGLVLLACMGLLAGLFGFITLLNNRCP